MFLAKVTTTTGPMLTACVLACGAFAPAGPATATGQTTAEQKKPAQETSRTQQPEKGTAAGAGLSPAQLAKSAKAATAVVEVKGRGRIGSAFCVHPAGLFLTNAHLIQGEITLVLNHGQETEKTCPAGVLRTDSEQDLALLRANGAKDFPAVPLGSDAGLEELADVWVFGYQLGPAPMFSASAATIKSLPPYNARPPRIQLSAALDAGHCGGPVLDKHGKVIGVVAAVQGGVSLATPASSVADFVARPEILFEPPLLGPANLHKAARFEARVTPLFPTATPLTVDLILKPSSSRARTYPMQANGDKYSVTAVPIPSLPGAFTVRLRAEFDDALLEATVADRAFKVGDQKVKLSQVRRIRIGPTPQVLLHDDKRFKGTLAGLDAVPMRLGGQTLSVDLAKALEVSYAPAAQTDRVWCTLLVKQGGKEILRQSRPAAYTFYNLQTAISNRFLAVRDALPRDNADIVQSERDRGKHQWRLVPSDRHPGCFHIQYMTDETCKYLEVFQANKGNGGRICLAAFHPDQVWRLIPTDKAGAYYIQSEVSGLCLDVIDGSRDEGARVGQALRHPQQVWRFLDPK
jgi:hypothetical protein